MTRINKEKDVKEMPKLDAEPEEPNQVQDVQLSNSTSDAEKEICTAFVVEEQGKLSCVYQNGDIQTWALIDTGASCSIISKQFLHTIVAFCGKS